MFGFKLIISKSDVLNCLRALFCSLDQLWFKNIQAEISEARTHRNTCNKHNIAHTFKTPNALFPSLCEDTIPYFCSTIFVVCCAVSFCCCSCCSCWRCCCCCFLFFCSVFICYWWGFVCLLFCCLLFALLPTPSDNKSTSYQSYGPFMFWYPQPTIFGFEVFFQDLTSWTV